MKFYNPFKFNIYFYNNSYYLVKRTIFREYICICPDDTVYILNRKYVYKNGFFGACSFDSLDKAQEHLKYSKGTYSKYLFGVKAEKNRHKIIKV